MHAPCACYCGLYANRHLATRETCKLAWSLSQEGTVLDSKGRRVELCKGSMGLQSQGVLVHLAVLAG